MSTPLIELTEADSPAVMREASVLGEAAAGVVGSLSALSPEAARQVLNIASCALADTSDDPTSRVHSVAWMFARARSGRRNDGPKPQTAMDADYIEARERYVRFWSSDRRDRTAAKYAWFAVQAAQQAREAETSLQAIEKLHAFGAHDESVKEKIAEATRRANAARVVAEEDQNEAERRAGIARRAQRRRAKRLERTHIIDPEAVKAGAIASQASERFLTANKVVESFQEVPSEEGVRQPTARTEHPGRHAFFYQQVLDGLEEAYREDYKASAENDSLVEKMRVGIDGHAQRYVMRRAGLRIGRFTVIAVPFTRKMRPYKPTIDEANKATELERRFDKLRAKGSARKIRKTRLPPSARLLLKED